MRHKEMVGGWVDQEEHLEEHRSWIWKPNLLPALPYLTCLILPAYRFIFNLTPLQERPVRVKQDA